MSEENVILLAQEIQRKTGRIEPEVLRLPLITNIPSPHQTKTVAAGATEKVFEFKLPNYCIGFILRVANVYYYDDLIKWKLDGKETDSAHIRRVIGTINAPAEITPWFRISFKISTIWEVTNNDTVAHEYEVLNEGFYIKEEDLPLLFRMAGVK